jgi:glutamine amidotransferase PdxT
MKQKMRKSTKALVIPTGEYMTIERMAEETGVVL